MILAYEEFVDFLAAGTTPQGVIDFRPSDAAKARTLSRLRGSRLETPSGCTRRFELRHLALPLSVSAQQSGYAAPPIRSHILGDIGRAQASMTTTVGECLAKSWRRCWRSVVRESKRALLGSPE
jgi:hypothetical protein